ncbi:unnamed protein product [Clonostachys rhizophaga]|uniref:Uncharacterized protein n=1 Tax=Clonostachys rhizophaga TaxID=160324 RepID=A0A9N9VL93_9HYPO|nr:unnamed protein product [Clonostachys rhizophaga]
MASTTQSIDTRDATYLQPLINEVLSDHLQGDGSPPLTRAVRLGNLELVRHFLDEDLVEQGTGNWPLSLAANLGHSDIVKLLLDRGADVYQRDPLLGEAIEAATLARHPITMRVLCEAGARLDHLYPGGDTILHRAVQLGDPGLVRLLVNSGAVLVRPASGDGQTAYLEMVGLLLELGAGQEDSIPYGHMPLILAARNGEVAILRLLFDHGWAALAIEHGSIVLQAVVGQGKLEAVMLLLEMGVSAEGRENGTTALHLAALGGHVVIAELLLANGADLEAGDDQRQTTPLCTAVMARHDLMVESLLRNGANPAAQNPDGASPLSLAAFGGRLDMVELMLEHGLDGEGMAEERVRLFQRAAVLGHTHLIELLLDSGVDVDHLHHPGCSALHIAIEQGHTELARLLLDRGAYPRARHQLFQYSPLHVCCRQDQPELARLLLDKGADPGDVNAYGMTPMHFAAENNSLSCIRVLFEYSADLSAVSSIQSTPLTDAILSNHKEAVKALIECGADPNIAQLRSPSLVLATGQTSMVELLIDLGADVSFLDPAGRTPLHAAAYDGHLEAARVLLERGADINTEDYAGYTPLTDAVGRGHYEVVRLLLDRGADPTVPSKASPCSCMWTPLNGAVCCGNTKILTQLLDAVGVHNLPVNPFGRSLIFFAVSHGRCEVVKLLIEMDENQTHLRDMYGSTPLGMAVRLGKEAVAQLLFNAAPPSLDADEFHGKSLRWWLDNAATPSMQELFRNLEASTGPREVNDEVTHYDPRSGAHCDTCLRKMSNAQPRYHCKICISGGFYSCVHCVKEGGECLDPSHELLYHATSPFETPR